MQPYLSLPASSPFMATERIHEPGTQRHVAKALRGREKEGLVNGKGAHELRATRPKAYTAGAYLRFP